MSEQQQQQQQRRRNEKEEEKRGEKEEEKGHGLDEKWARDRVRAVAIAAILIWGGLVALAGTLGLFDFNWENHGWAVFFIGVGVILIVKVIVRALIPEYRRRFGGSLIIALIIIAVGIGDLVSWNWGYIGPAILIIIGLIIVLRGVFRRRTTK